MIRTSVRSTLLLLTLGLRAEEGMWTFDRPPLAQLKAAYAFSPDQAWLDHLRLATVLFGGSGTGAFVGREGLVLTNHHVALPYLQRLRVADLAAAGFVARTRAEERPIPGLELRVLVSTRNVTPEAAQAVPPGTPPEEARAARQAALEGLLRQERAESGLACELVAFSPGQESWIYRYRTYRDVRLVLAPEAGIAAFGGEWDNFTYPRHDLDFSLFRVYEQGRPYAGPSLAWSRQGLSRGDLTLVAGHPGRTRRLETWAQLDFRRRVENPLLVRTLERRLHALTTYAAGGSSQARQVIAEREEAANFLKVYREELRGLEDPGLSERLRRAEAQLRNRLEADPHSAGWPALEPLLAQLEPLAKEHQLLHGPYRSLGRGPLEQVLRVLEGTPDGVPAVLPLNRPLEAVLLAAGLEEAQEWLGPDHPLVRALLGTRPPQELAVQVLRDTRLETPGFLRRLRDGDPEALADPLVQLARRLAPRSRAVQARHEALERQLQDQVLRIDRARPAGQAPEANFTLRLGYGTVQPYPAEGTLQPPFTTFGGLFDRADAWGPEAEEGSWALPPRWLQRRQALDPALPLNVITTNDIIGGSSGSPVVNRQGELVGLVFDGNLASIRGRFHYDAERNRCIAVDARAILEALAKVYEAERLVRELTAP